MTQAVRSKLHVPTWTITTVAGLCAFMTFWTLLLPGNWTSGFRPNHMRTLDYLSDLASHYIPVPDNMFSKYKGQTAVVLLHHLPSAVWAVAMPLQLSTQLRIKYRQVHRWMGWAASVCGFLLIVGFGLMAKKGLGGNFAMYAVSVWFLYTLYMGVATARQKKYMQHRIWMLRHVGSGIWVVVLRVFVVLAGIAAKVLGYDWWTAGEAVRLVGFLICNVAAIAVSVGVVEVMVWREQMPQREKVVVKSPERALTKEE